LSLKSRLNDKPVIYEIVPPRRDTSRFNTELRGVERVLIESRIDAINIPELISRREERGDVRYSPGTIPPEEYAMMIKDYKEPMVNIVAPRLPREEFIRRAQKVLHQYNIPNLVVVGRERDQDAMPGPGVVEALGLLRAERRGQMTFGGICIFDRVSRASPEYGGGKSRLDEAKRVWIKADAGCDFVTSQITFDPVPAISFLSRYQELCERTGRRPLTVIISLATIPSPRILSLIEGLDVTLPPRQKRRLVNSEKMAEVSLEIATEVFSRIIAEVEKQGVEVPLGLQIEQVGLNNDGLSLALLDRLYPLL
jgi:5,10-methylenetetrahydrofolate reductase